MPKEEAYQVWKAGSGHVLDIPLLIWIQMVFRAMKIPDYPLEPSFKDDVLASLGRIDNILGAQVAKMRDLTEGIHCQK
ncbi:hypothetical protein FRX31_031037 [Thalictrum thalictroides]|uniref:Uncharacterized protein n=1 Tax=Thalictrum thalictroides TaxID=46969 RepID=A0A7J6V363_THATH|nr:hypothetical protein FRX31_031037 [Thalictrum thalictroides]